MFRYSYVWIPVLYGPDMLKRQRFEVYIGPNASRPQAYGVDAGVLGTLSPLDSAQHCQGRTAVV